MTRRLTSEGFQGFRESGLPLISARGTPQRALCAASQTSTARPCRREPSSSNFAIVVVVLLRNLPIHSNFASKSKAISEKLSNKIHNILLQTFLHAKKMVEKEVKVMEEGRAARRWR
jgi:hypothetical protein